MNNLPSPQDYLDDLHAIGITRLFLPHIDPRDRAAGIRRARQELGRLRGELSLQRDQAAEINGALSPEALRRATAPYSLLLLLHEQLVEEVGDLERSLSTGKPVPYSFDFGRYIFGDEASGDWFIGGQSELDEWGRIQQFKARLDALREQSQPAREQLSGVRSELEALTAEHEKRQAKIDRRQQPATIRLQIALLVLAGVASGLIGWQMWHADRDFSTVAWVLCGVCAIMIPIAILNWRNPRTRKLSQQRKLERQIQQARAQGMQQRQSYQPLDLQIKALEVHYNRMLDGWEAARLIKKRLDGFIAEAQPLRERVDAIRAELESQRQQRDKLLKKQAKREKRGAFFRRMFLHIMLVAASGAVGFYFDYMGEADYAAIMYGLGAFCILLVPLAYIDWKNRSGKLESQLRQLETRMLQLQTEGKQIMKRYHPLELQIKTLIAQYKRTRAGITAPTETQQMN
ncbi:MAG: hypothetical protein F4Y70_05335 [Chloroflexi bacterium]|nr:hypothetical protein [Chloroflexota bacterium]MXX82880.1 hypothetical protein [Chloroflexota bacterium]MYD38677.1 hypothetical protein [Chloroflexota bacterium]MYH66285.1 hypothetical protein [Chloroflexota bacterium]